MEKFLEDVKLRICPNFGDLETFNSALRYLASQGKYGSILFIGFHALKHDKYIHYSKVVDILATPIRGISGKESFEEKRMQALKGIICYSRLNLHYLAFATWYVGFSNEKFFEHLVETIFTTLEREDALEYCRLFKCE